MWYNRFINRWGRQTDRDGHKKNRKAIEQKLFIFIGTTGGKKLYEKETTDRSSHGTGNDAYCSSLYNRKWQKRQRY